ncbi:type IV secretory system conjugative DNA transfer family protein [Burkholderia cenocepacia]|uniref:type IV secretory system conjugative DNA transfer family protein n=1 Tax=Burkholderia cenocepacia TaxID=95486 RepID=UPI00264AA54C|nr:type IV secretory system conjugative DNA transfer family protein [Burkholderia cenocepacia]MDN7539955.1 type IV secretory system conjugative DNA transfer family protein [Burkholderia cenocepacia]
MHDAQTAEPTDPNASTNVDTGPAVAVAPKVKAPPYDRNAAAFIDRLTPALRKDAGQGMAYTGLMGRRARERISKNVKMQVAELFRRKIPITDHAPFDLQDKEGDSGVSGNGTPLVQLVKATGDDCEIGYGGSSLAETALLYAHPLVTVASEAFVATGHMGIPGFVLTQAAYAIGTLALLGRNWRYIIRPTAQYTLGIFAVQTAAARYIPELAGPVVAAGTFLMLARPFLESLIANRSGKDRLFKLPENFQAPNDNDAMMMRQTQINAASNFSKNGPVIILGTARGHLKLNKCDPLAPDPDTYMGLSAHEDLTTHLLMIGETGSGKTGLITPLTLQWLAYGQFRNGVFENCGGALLLDGKGSLPDEIIKALREQGLDQVIEIVHVTPEPGGAALALLEGMTPEQVTTALLAATNDDSDLSSFWTVSSGNWLRHTACLLWACYEMEQMELADKAKERGFTSYQAWSDHLDKEAQAKTNDDGSRFTTWTEYVAWRKRNGYDVPEPFASAVRHFYWHFAALHDFAMSYMEDSKFVSGTEPVPDPKTGQLPLLSDAPTLPGGAGLVGWLRKHPDMVADTPRGKLIRAALKFASFHLPRQRAELRSDILGTLSTMFTPIMSNVKLVDWAYLEKGCDLLACMRGAVVGISLPETLYQEAGMVITTLAKKRVFNAVKARGAVGDWQKHFPEQRPLLCIVDEAHLLLSRKSTSDEGSLLSIARSLGLRCVFASQTVNAFYDRLGEDAAKAFMGNFVSWCVMKSLPASHAWANDRLMRQRVHEYSYYLSGGLKEITSNDFQRAHLHAFDSARIGKPELNPNQRLAMLKRLRYDLSRPTDVLLTKADREALKNPNDHSGRLPASLAKLALMFSVGAVTTNLWEVVRGTVALGAGLARRAAGALSWKFMGGAVEHDDYKPPRFYVKDPKTEKEVGPNGSAVELFPEDDWGLLHHRYVGMISVKRGGVPRRDLCDTIGNLSIDQIRTFAEMQGIPTVYDELDRRKQVHAAQAAANDATKAAA